MKELVSLEVEDFWEGVLERTMLLKPYVLSRIPCFDKVALWPQLSALNLAQNDDH